VLCEVNDAFHGSKLWVFEENWVLVEFWAISPSLSVGMLGAFCLIFAFFLDAMGAMLKG
jgi:hypothetical protein